MDRVNWASPFLPHTVCLVKRKKKLEVFFFVFRVVEATTVVNA
jgi:hypothetical protein